MGKPRSSYVCQECNRAYTTNGARQAHIKRVHQGLKRHACTFCESEFFGSNVLADHVRRVHTGEKPFQCSDCSSAFVSSSGLRVHEKTHSEDRPFACPHLESSCKKSFKTHSTLAAHVQTHSTQKKYVCDQCGAGFNQQSVLKVHVMGKHTGEKPQSCTFCEYKCISSDTLRTHVRTHTGEKPYRCTVDNCRSSFSSKSGLGGHIKAHHGSENRQRHTCTECSKSYSCHRSLKSHVCKNAAVVKNKTTFICATCGEICSDQLSLKAHRAVCRPSNREFVCSLCEKLYRTRSGLVYHLGTHTGEKAKCGTCDKVLASTGELRRHKRTHEAGRVKAFACEWCPSRFFESSNLSAHRSRCRQRPEYKETLRERVERNRQTGEHRFFCETCAKPFPTKYRFERHMQVHQERQRKFRCAGCGKKYLWKSHLQRHQAKAECNTNRNLKDNGSGIRVRDLRIVLPCKK